MSYSFPEVPKHPPGYIGDRDRQIAFLNIVKNELTAPSKKAKIPAGVLSESIYYADILRKKPNGTNDPVYTSLHNTLFKEQLRRIKPPFRLPESSRPDMPHQAGIPTQELISELAKDIYLPVKGEAARQRAYQIIVDTYLTDWVNRKGFVENGVQMHRLPFYDNVDFLIGLREYITKILQQCEEKPNPKTLNKRPGNSTRQQLLKDILEKINKRIPLLLDERLNKMIESGGRRRTHKRKHTKRRKTRRN
jgi:hypothetical protein